MNEQQTIADLRACAKRTRDTGYIQGVFTTFDGTNRSCIMGTMMIIGEQPGNPPDWSSWNSYDELSDRAAAMTRAVAKIVFEGKTGLLSAKSHILATCLAEWNNGLSYTYSLSQEEATDKVVDVFERAATLLESAH